MTWLKPGTSKQRVRVCARCLAWSLSHHAADCSLSIWSRWSRDDLT
nr:MAG TPA: hypothetical protein [Caudoviricetes sp.]